MVQDITSAIPAGAPAHVSPPGFRPAWWVRGKHLQTLWSRFARRLPRPAVQRREIDTPDGDVIELWRVAADRDAPRLLLLHGLEGSIRSHYAAGMLDQAARRGWGADLLSFRGCGTAPNRARRFYHSGDTADLALAIASVTEEFPDAPLLLAGVSLGGNVLLKYLGECAGELPPRIRAAAAVSVPFDLESGARFLQQGVSRIYDRHFLRSLRAKALRKLDRYPDLFDRAALEGATSIYEFDDAVTAPVHGFTDAVDYYRRSSAIHWLTGIRLPTLLLSAYDDPFLPRAVLERARSIAAANPRLVVEFHESGGHVGFVGGRVPWRPRYHAEERVMEFLASEL